METMTTILKEVYGGEGIGVILQPYKNKKDRFIIRVTDTDEQVPIITVIMDDEADINGRRICNIISVVMDDLYEGKGYFSKFIHAIEKNFDEVEFKFVCNVKMQSILEKKGYRKIEPSKGFISALYPYGEDDFIPVHMIKDVAIEEL